MPPGMKLYNKQYFILTNIMRLGSMLMASYMNTFSMLQSSLSDTWFLILLAKTCVQFALMSQPLCYRGRGINE